VNCFECARQNGATTTAVALCRNCNAGLCMEHLGEAATDRSRGGLQAACSHVTWDVPTWPKEARPPGTTELQ
jgi:hypothetical protein